MPEDVTLDVRQMPPWERHPTIFKAFDDLVPGQSLILVNDHEPKPLYYQFAAEMPDRFEWKAEERAPREWVTRITKKAA